MQSVTDCIEYLASTDERFGELKGACKAQEYLIKTAKATAFLDAQGTMAEKEAQAYVTDIYKEKTKEAKELYIEMETIAAKRKTAELTIEVWRTQNANRRAGNI